MTRDDVFPILDDLLGGWDRFDSLYQKIVQLKAHISTMLLNKQPVYVQGGPRLHEYTVRVFNEGYIENLDGTNHVDFVHVGFSIKENGNMLLDFESCLCDPTQVEREVKEFIQYISQL